MEFLNLENLQEEKYFSQIQKMLIEADDEFVPPLSSRFSTTQKHLNFENKNNDGVFSYFNEMKKQRILLACEEGSIRGFISYRENHVNDEIKELPNIYISTVIVKKEHRGKGITAQLYKKLFDEYKNISVFTRTWSTNSAHIKILLKLGFEVLKTLKDDRGEGIDTVYFKKSLKFENI